MAVPDFQTITRPALGFFQLSVFFARNQFQSSKTNCDERDSHHDGPEIVSRIHVSK